MGVNISKIYTLYVYIHMPWLIRPHCFCGWTFPPSTLLILITFTTWFINHVISTLLGILNMEGQVEKYVLSIAVSHILRSNHWSVRWLNLPTSSLENLFYHNLIQLRWFPHSLENNKLIFQVLEMSLNFKKIWKLGKILPVIVSKKIYLVVKQKSQWINIIICLM